MFHAPINPPKCVGIFQFEGRFIVKSIWSHVLCIRCNTLASNCNRRSQCYLGGGGGESDKTILIVGKTTYPFTMQGESMCTHERKGGHSLLHL